MIFLEIKIEKDIKLVLSNKIFEKLRDCVNKSLPNEACGIIFGEINQIRKKIYCDDFEYHYKANNFECIQSDNKSMASFLIENVQDLHEIIQTRLDLKNKKRLISIFHSHPSGAHPSSTDLDQMKFLDNFSSSEQRFISKAFKNLIWTIMSSKNYDLRGFIYLNSNFFQIEVIIKDDL